MYVLVTGEGEDRDGVEVVLEFSTHLGCRVAEDRVRPRRQNRRCICIVSQELELRCRNAYLAIEFVECS